jgi:copper chaperone CopZ
MATDATTYRFLVEGMHCASCGLLIDDDLTDLDGVLDTRTSVRTGTSTVVLDPDRCDPDTVIRTITALGYRAILETP